MQEDQILKIIKGLKNSSATGVDYIDTRTIKLIAELITPVLTYIINLSIQSSTFPTIWKWAKVIPLILKSVSTAANPIQGHGEGGVHPANGVPGAQQIDTSKPTWLQSWSQHNNSSSTVI